MARRSVHMKKSVLSAKSRTALPASAFAVPAERKFPINDLYHGRLALIYVMSPSNAAYREEVVGAVLSRYPELRFFWESRSKNLSKRRRATPATRIAANPSHSYEDSMPIYTLANPLRYIDTPVIKVGRLVKSRGNGHLRIAGGSENHAMNPATGAAFCGAGLDRRGGMFGGSPRDGYIHPVKGDVVTCMRCIKLLNMNAGEGIVERDLDAGARGKTAGHKNKMLKGGDQGPYVSANARFAGGRGYYKAFADRKDAKGVKVRGRLGVSDFAERAFYDDRPSQTFGPKRGRIMVDEEAIIAPEFRAARPAKRPAAGGKRRKPAPVPQVAPMVRIAAGAEEYMDNPRRNPRRSGAKRRAAGLAKGQSLMALAAQAYHAGEYDSMQEALRGVSRRARRNPFTGGMGGSGGSGGGSGPFLGGRIIMAEGGGSDIGGGYRTPWLPRTPGEASKGPPASGGGSSSGSTPPATGTASGGGSSTPPAKANPRRRGSKRRTAAQSNAALAMKLYHSGRARSLAEAWDMIRRGR